MKTKRRFSRFRLSSMLLAMAVVAVGLKLLHSRSLEPKRVLRAANVSVVTIRGSAVHHYVTFRKSSPRTVREFEAIKALTSESEGVSIDVSDIAMDALPNLVELPKVRRLVVQESDLSGQSIDLSRFQLSSVAFLNCDLSNSQLRLPDELRSMRVDGSTIDSARVSIAESAESLRCLSANFVVGDTTELLRQVTRTVRLDSVSAYGQSSLSELIAVCPECKFTIGQKQLDMKDYNRSLILVRSDQFVTTERQRLSSRSTDSRIILDDCD